MMNGMEDMDWSMGWGMSWGMGLISIVIVGLLILVILALMKYLYSDKD